jgi:hypothetical protein
MALALGPLKELLEQALLFLLPLSFLLRCFNDKKRMRFREWEPTDIDQADGNLRPAVQAGWNNDSRFERASRGTAQEPGPISCPSESLASEGRPRMRRKLSFGTASEGSICSGKRLREAGAPKSREATLIEGSHAEDCGVIVATGGPAIAGLAVGTGSCFFGSATTARV